MSGTAIEVEGLGKRYRIGTRERYRTLRDQLARMMTPWRRAPGDGREEFWALRDVSFSIPRGSVVGIVGRNGAGKSTLLKILSRVTEPSTGRALVRGRIGSLLEVGTGFHPELTGRENILLNGAIIGMRRAEVRARFDQIVAFSELERFIDTPVKRYSSGMYLRLAFAIAAHLDTDILLADEVLAVGDAQFQRKCLGRMSEAVRDGRTVLLVSHQLAAIRSLCQHALWLEGGALVQAGPAAGVLDAYLRSLERPVDLAAELAALPPDPSLRLTGIELGQAAASAGCLSSALPLDIAISYRVLTRSVGLRIWFDLLDQHENLLFRSFHDGDADAVPVTEPGEYRSRAVIPADWLAPARYVLAVHAGIYDVRNCTPPAGVRIPIEVHAGGRLNRAYPNDPVRGLLAPAIAWRSGPA